MSIEPHPRQGEKVREDLNSYSHPGADCFWRRGAIILFILAILAILIQTAERARGLLRSYRTLSSCSCCVSIDIQVLSDLEQAVFGGERLLRGARVFLTRCKGLEDLNVYRT